MKNDNLKNETANNTNTVLGEIKLCDICGEPFTGFSYHVVDENYNVLKGLIQCGKCLAENLEDNLSGYGFS